MAGAARHLPVLSWAPHHERSTLTSDLVAAAIVTVMLIPQSLAYAMLAGLPPEIGLYASIAPLIAYAAFGTSRALAVGPVAVVSLMTLTAAGRLAPPGTVDFIDIPQRQRETNIHHHHQADDLGQRVEAAEGTGRQSSRFAQHSAR